MKFETKLFLNCGIRFVKNDLKGASKNAQNMYQNSTKNMKLSAIFGRFRGLNDLSYKISEATFQPAIFPELDGAVYFQSTI